MNYKNVFLGLGSNIDDRLNYLQQAFNHLNENPQISVIGYSSVYETEPYGLKNQNNYYNAALKIETDFSILELFNFVKSIEKTIGRKERIRWGEREIDVDILIFSDLVYSDDKITVPHKDILNRDFVILPVSEIDPEAFLPDKKICLVSAVDNLDKNHIIKKFSHKFG